MNVQEGYNIYTLSTSRNQWEGIGMVGEQTTIVTPMGSNIGKLQVKICGLIMDLESRQIITEDDKRMISVGIKGKATISERIEFTLIDALRYRHGTVYYGIQYAEGSGKTRIIIIGSDKIKHGGGAFATNPMQESIETIQKEVLEGLVKYFKQGKTIEVRQEVMNALNAGTYEVGI